jgi:amino acid permease
MLLTSTLLALFVRNLGLVLSLVGATGSTTITFILPGTVRLAMVDRG